MTDPYQYIKDQMRIEMDQMRKENDCWDWFRELMCQRTVELEELPGIVLGAEACQHIDDCWKWMTYREPRLAEAAIERAELAIIKQRPEQA